MTKNLGRGLACIAALLSLFATTTPAAAQVAFTCSGGTIPPGVYSSLTVTGNCSIPSGAVTVLGNVTITQNAVLNALSDALVVVNGNVNVGNGAILVLGCTREVGCNAPSSDRVAGNLLASKPLAVILHNNTIQGNVIVHGGGGGATCHANSVLSAIVGFPAPPFTDIEDNQVAGNVTVSIMRSCFFAVIRNRVDGNVVVANNIFADPDANEIVTNTIMGNLSCFNNSPAAQVGDSGGSPNVVAGVKSGECARL